MLMNSDRWMPHMLCVLLLAVMSTGCANYTEPFQVKKAHPGLTSQTHQTLKQLPPPQEKIVAAVYRFRDQTGQYKATQQASSFSTAVTQGATSILLRALEESGWFTPIEREGLSNLLNERQIIQQIRQQYQDGNGQSLGQLPPLLYGGVLLEGGIIGYDTNVMTGGAGARFFGIGGSGKFRQHQVTVYLRAVSTQSGRILKTVHTTKTILSQKVDGNAFLFVDQDRLLEAEAGYSYNEPSVLAVTEAIDESVKNLIIEGVRDDLWTLKNPVDSLNSALQDYDEEVRRASRRDYFDRVLASKSRPGLGIGVSLGGQQYQGDYKSPETRPSLGVHLRKSLTPRWTAGFAASAGRIAARDAFERDALTAELQLGYLMMPHRPVTPYLQMGAGVTNSEAGSFTWGEDLIPHASAGAGFEIMTSDRLGIRAGVHARYGLYDEFDGASAGSYHDSIWQFDLGLTYYLPGF